MATTDAPRETLRDEWVVRLGALVDSVQLWAEEFGWATRRIDETMEDREIGTYEAPGLHLQRDFARVLLEPIARSAPGAEGVIDLYMMPAYDDIASVYHYDGGWHLHRRAPAASAVATSRRTLAEPLTRETLRAVLEEMSGRAS